MTRPRRFGLSGLLAALGTAAPALAQAPPQQPSRQWEFAGGVSWVAPQSLGTTDADLLAPDGSPFPLFRARNEAGAGLGFEAHLGTSVARRLDVEFSGAWTRFDARSLITDDADDVPEVTLSERLTRFSVEGSVVWRFAERNRVVWFLRGGAGWMREIASDRALSEDGWLVNGGLGVKYWPGANPAGQGAFGLRGEFRVLTRKDGIAIDDGGFRIWPVVAGSAVVRF